MIHELIDPKKKTNKPTASRPIRTLLDNRPFSDPLTFDPSDSENKEVDSSATFIPPWLRNSLGLSQRHKQSHLTPGHSEQKTTKTINRFKESNQNEFESLKTNEEEDVCKNVPNQYESLPTHCSQDENLLQTTTQERTDEILHRGQRLHWQLMTKESDSDSSFPNTEVRRFDKKEPKMTNSDLLTLAEIGKIREEEKKKLKYMRQKSRGRRRGTCDQKIFDQSKIEVESIADMKGKNAIENCPKKNVHTVPSDIREFETKFLLLQKCHSGKSPRLNQPELRLLQDMKEHVGSIGDFDVLLEQEKKVNMIKSNDFWTSNVGDKKMDDSPVRKYREDIKPDADKDSLFSTDDENDIKRFSEFLSKNKNAEEKRKCLEEVRNYFERKRKSRMSRRRYLEDLKSKVPPEMEKKDEHKEKLKCRELTMILPNRGKRSKFALCDEEVVERAVDETLQKFVELYHFHVSPRVIGNMKKNILQALQSDSVDSSGSKVNLEQKKSSGIKIRSSTLTTTKQSPKRDVSYSHPRHSAIIEAPNNEIAAVKEPKKKTFKTLIVSSSEQIANQPKEVDLIENERLKYLNKEFEIFFRSIQNHLDVSSLKIQSIILEKEETNPLKQVQFVYNVSKKELETEKCALGNNFRETQEMKTFKEAGAQANIKKDVSKKRVRIQSADVQDTLEQCLQTDEKTWMTQYTQTEGDHVTFRELKELESFQINAGLYRMVKSKEEGKFYLYPEQKENTAQPSSANDVTASKDKKIKKKELLTMLSKERNKDRVMCIREKDKNKSKKNKKVYYSGSHLKAGPSRKDRETKKKQLDTKSKDPEMEEGSINCLYFRNNEENTSEPMSYMKEPQTEMESVADTTEKLGVGDAKEEHLGCVWLWNGEKISPGCDLKMHVENLLKEKLREMTGIDSLPKNLLMRDLKLNKSEGETLQQNLLVTVSGQSKVDSEALPEMEGPQKNFETKKSNSVFCYTNYGNLNTEKSPRVQISENDTTERQEKSNVKPTGETKGVKSSQLSLIQDKSVRNVATQNSQQKILSLSIAKTRMQSKTTIPPSRKKENKRTQSTKPLTQKLVNMKKAEGILRAVEEIKRLQMQLDSCRKDYYRDSDSLMDDRSSSYGSKNDNDDPLSMFLSLREGSHRAEDTSSCTVKSRLRKVVDLVNHEVQTSSKADMNEPNSEESGDVVPPTGSQRHLQLIEDFLGRVNHREKENLWNDVRKFIKTKLGRDINDEGAKEVCIEIEQDMPKNDHGTVKQAVLAKGHYVKNEGDVEVEIDLTLDDLEKILRQRQKKIRKQRLHRKKYKRFISSSSVQSDLNREEIRKYHKYLNKVAGLEENYLTESPSVSIKKNRGN